MKELLPAGVCCLLLCLSVASAQEVANAQEADGLEVLMTPLGSDHLEVSRSLVIDRNAVGCGAHTYKLPNSNGCFQPWAWQDHFTKLSVLGNHELAGDSFTEPLWLQVGQEGVSLGATPFRELWYVPYDQLTGTGILQRHWSGPSTNHLDAPKGAVANYTPEHILGYPYETQLPGTEALHRLRQASPVDHRLHSPLMSMPAGYSSDAHWTTSTTVPRYGYPRYGTELEDCQHWDNPAYEDSISNPTLAVRFNKVFGGVIAQITYQHPTEGPIELIRPGPGLGAQGVLFAKTNKNYGQQPGETENCLDLTLNVDYNPTEAGGKDFFNTSDTRRRLGSPIVSTVNTGSTMVRELRPLNFGHHLWVGTQQESPLAWRGMFRRTTSLLDANSLSLETAFKADQGATAVQQQAFNASNSFWLWMDHFGDGNTGSLEAELLDLATGSLTDIPLPTFKPLENVSKPCGFSNCAGKAIVVSRLNDTLAVGIVNRDTNNGFDKHYNVRFHCDGAAGTAAGICNANQVLTLETFRQGLTPTTSYSTDTDLSYFVVADNKADVVSKLQTLMGGVPLLPPPNITQAIGYTAANPPQLSWDPVAGAKNYRLWVYDWWTGSLVHAKTVNSSTTSYTLPTALNGTPSYRFRMKTRNQNNEYGDYGDYEYFSFQEGTLPNNTLPAPSTLSPSGSTSDTTPNFSWTQVAGARKYRIEVRTAGGTVVEARTVNPTPTTWTVSSPLSPGNYQWRVKTWNAGGVYGPWSAYRTFTVQ